MNRFVSFAVLVILYGHPAGGATEAPSTLPVGRQISIPETPIFDVASIKPANQSTPLRGAGVRESTAIMRVQCCRQLHLP
jgi:hypothetical protein